MEARIKSLVLPEAPRYEGNTGKPLDSVGRYIKRIREGKA